MFSYHPRRLENDAIESEEKPDMDALGHAPPLTPDRGSDIEKSFLAFLTGYPTSEKPFYEIIWRALVDNNVSERIIYFNHVKEFNPVLANTIHIFFDR